MDEIVELVRIIGHQQGENAYYRACHGLLKRLQEGIEEYAEELHRLYRSASSTGESASNQVYQVTNELQKAILELVEQACSAQQACEEICPVSPSASACEIFRPLLLNADMER